MVTEPHDLHHEFPEYRDTIYALKAANAHFSRLFDEYHQVNKHVQRVENEAEVATGEALEELKKQRLRLKDELYGILRAHAAV